MQIKIELFNLQYMLKCNTYAIKVGVWAIGAVGVMLQSLKVSAFPESNYEFGILTEKRRNSRSFNRKVVKWTTCKPARAMVTSSICQSHLDKLEINQNLLESAKFRILRPTFYGKSASKS